MFLFSEPGSLFLNTHKHVFKNNVTPWTEK